MLEKEKNELGKILNEDMNKSFTHDREKPNTSAPKERTTSQTQHTSNQTQQSTNTSQSTNNEANNSEEKK